MENRTGAKKTTEKKELQVIRKGEREGKRALAVNGKAGRKGWVLVRNMSILMNSDNKILIKQLYVLN